VNRDLGSAVPVEPPGLLKPQVRCPGIGHPPQTAPEDATTKAGLFQVHLWSSLSLTFRCVHGRVSTSSRQWCPLALALPQMEFGLSFSPLTSVSTTQSAGSVSSDATKILERNIASVLKA
jgi:hypothetical protein